MFTAILNIFLSLTTALLIPQISKALFCSEVLRSDVSASENNFLHSKKYFERLNVEQLKRIVPSSPEEKLAWLEALSQRLSNANDHQISFMPNSKRAQKKVLTLVDLPGQTISLKMIEKLLAVIYSENQQYFSFLKSFSRLKLNSAEENYLRWRIESEFRKNGLLQIIYQLEQIPSQSYLEKIKLRIEEKKNEISFIMDTILGTGLIYASVMSGHFIGAVMPVWRWKQTDMASFEAYNWALSKSLKLATYVVLMYLLSDEFFQVLGIDTTPYLDDLITNREVLEQAALDALSADALEMGYTLDPDTQTQIKNKTIRELKLIIN